MGIGFNAQTDACAVTHLLQCDEARLRAAPRPLVVGRRALVLTHLVRETHRLRLSELLVDSRRRHSATYSTHLPATASTAVNWTARNAGPPFAANFGAGFAVW